MRPAFNAFVHLGLLRQMRFYFGRIRFESPSSSLFADNFIRWLRSMILVSTGFCESLNQTGKGISTSEVASSYETRSVLLELVSVATAKLVTLRGQRTQVTVLWSLDSIFKIFS